MRTSIATLLDACRPPRCDWASRDRTGAPEASHESANPESRRSGGCCAGLATLSNTAPASAAEFTSVEGCVQQRSPTAALVKGTDDSLTEIDLHLVIDGPFSITPDSCLKFYGESLGPGQNRVYGQAGWVLRASTIDKADEHSIDKSQELDQPTVYKTAPGQ